MKKKTIYKKFFTSRCSKGDKMTNPPLECRSAFSDLFHFKCFQEVKPKRRNAAQLFVTQPTAEHTSSKDALTERKQTNKKLASCSSRWKSNLAAHLLRKAHQH